MTQAGKSRLSLILRIACSNIASGMNCCIHTCVSKIKIKKIKKKPENMHETEQRKILCTSY